MAVTRFWRQPTALVPTGVGVWLGTVAVGMALRVLAGQGTAFAFILVALGLPRPVPAGLAGSCGGGRPPSF